MLKNEFAELFEGLTGHEFARFGDYIRSPFFEVPNRIVNLYELIEKKYDKLSDSPLSREEISDSFYPGRKYGDTQLNIRKLISEFKKYYDEFLSELEYRRQDFHRNLFLLKQLARLGKPDEFDKVFDKTNLLLECRTVRDEEYYLFKINLLAEAYKIEGSSFKKFEDDLAFKIQELVDLYYYAYKMYLFQKVEAKSIVMNRAIEHLGKFHKEIFSDIKSNTEYYMNHPEIYARYLHLNFSTDPDKESDIRAIILYLDKISDELKIDCYYHYTDLIGFCNRNVMNGFIEFEKMILDITHVLDEKGMFFSHEISDNILKTIIESYFGNSQYNEAIQFLNKYEDKPELSRNKGYMDLSFAKALFFQGNYKKSRIYLNKVNYNDFIHYIDAKLIEVRINYEERSFNEVYSIIDSAKKYIKQHKEIGQIYKQSYQNFINYLISAVRLYENKAKGILDEYDKQNLILKIESTKYLYGAFWILDKVKEI